MCVILLMSETLSVRLPAEDKRALVELAARKGESVNALVRQAIRGKILETLAPTASPIAQFFSSVNVETPAPTNANVRRAFQKRRV